MQTCRHVARVGQVPDLDHHAAGRGTRRRERVIGPQRERRQLGLGIDLDSWSSRSAVVPDGERMPSAAARKPQRTCRVTADGHGLAVRADGDKGMAAPRRPSLGYRHWSLLSAGQVVRVPQVDLKVALDRKDRRIDIRSSAVIGIFDHLLDRHQPLAAGSPTMLSTARSGGLKQRGGAPATGSRSTIARPLSSGKIAATHCPTCATRWLTNQPGAAGRPLPRRRGPCSGCDSPWSQGAAPGRFVPIASSEPSLDRSARMRSRPVPVAEPQGKRRSAAVVVPRPRTTAPRHLRTERPGDGRSGPKTRPWRGPWAARARGPRPRGAPGTSRPRRGAWGEARPRVRGRPSLG